MSINGWKNAGMNQVVGTDLFKAIEVLERKSSKYRPYGSVVRRYYAIVSAGWDLLQARRACDLLENYLPKSSYAEESQSIGEGVVSSALFWQATMLYGRATFTTSEKRFKSGIGERINPSLQAAHSRIKDIRNLALAHFSGGGANWNAEALVLRISHDRCRPIALHERYNYRADDVRDLKVLISSAMEIYADIKKSRYDGFIIAHTNLWKTDSRFCSVIVECGFNPEDMFELQATIDEYRRMMNSNEPVGNSAFMGRPSN
ncbi:hypothetical protein [Sphingomonas sp. NFR15]|uniref:hypothetical protein n=1 Tax=Sphingomonas sp. NFR15 TaxID=1566282 RepID=UPI00115FF762|nr:hypothetical protein [Sphingomonas sp. NFR15]